jgi:vitamin B12 transporter
VDERERLTTFSVSNFGAGRFEDATAFEEDRGNTAGYAQVLLAPGQRIDVQGGLRFDHNEVFGDFTTWRLGLVYRPVAGVRLFGSGGTAFRQPTFAEQFARTAFEVGNPELQPEESRSWEAGGELSLARVTLTATYFAQRFRDLIQYRAAPAGEPTYANIARARSDGVELGTRLLLRAGLSATADYTWLETEVQDDGGLGTTTYLEGEPLLRRPAHTLGLGLGWQAPHGGWYSVRVQRTGSRADVDFREFPAVRVDLAAYTLVDASAAIPLSLLGAVGEQFRLTLWGQNLFDADYESVIGFRGRGRTLMVGIRFSR